MVGGKSPYLKLRSHRSPENFFHPDEKLREEAGHVDSLGFLTFLLALCY